MQLVPPEQTLPHAPQLFGSVPVFAQEPLAQGVHERHIPETHISPAPHPFPQLPQFASSTRTSTHAVPHNWSGDAQPGWHAPLTQLSTGPHATPQAPQSF